MLPLNSNRPLMFLETQDGILPLLGVPFFEDSVGSAEAVRRW